MKRSLEKKIIEGMFCPYCKIFFKVLDHCFQMYKSKDNDVKIEHVSSFKLYLYYFAWHKSYMYFAGTHILLSSLGRFYNFRAIHTNKELDFLVVAWSQFLNIFLKLTL